MRPIHQQMIREEPVPMLTGGSLEVDLGRAVNIGLATINGEVGQFFPQGAVQIFIDHLVFEPVDQGNRAGQLFCQPLAGAIAYEGIKIDLRQTGRKTGPVSATMFQVLDVRTVEPAQALPWIEQDIYK